MRNPEYRENSDISVKNKHELTTAIEAVWPSQENSLQKSIRYELHRHRLYAYEPGDILSEAIQRAIHHLSKKGEIPNIIGWLRLTSRRIIQEKSREEFKQATLLKKLRKKENVQPLTDTSIFDDAENKRLAILLTERLDEPEKSIIHGMSEHLSWKAICIRLEKKGLLLPHESPTDLRTIERIKKKGNRTAKKLKNFIQEAGKLSK